MTTILNDSNGDAILWTESEGDQLMLCDGHTSTELFPGEDVGKAAAEWMRSGGNDWTNVRPRISIPGVSWCTWGDDVALVRQTGAGWVCSDGNTYPTSRQALAHEVRAWAEGDGEPFDIDASDDDVLSGRVIR